MITVKDILRYNYNDKKRALKSLEKSIRIHETATPRTAKGAKEVEKRLNNLKDIYIEISEMKD